MFANYFANNFANNNFVQERNLQQYNDSLQTILQRLCKIIFLVTHTHCSSMSKTWKEMKKDLPKDWAIQVAERLKTNKLELTAKQVSQVRSGDIQNFEWQTNVWQQINSLVKETRFKRKKLARLKVA